MLLSRREALLVIANTSVLMVGNVSNVSEDRPTAPKLKKGVPLYGQAYRRTKKGEDVAIGKSFKVTPTMTGRPYAIAIAADFPSHVEFTQCGKVMSAARITEIQADDNLGAVMFTVPDFQLI